jgi:hypothetical protein
MVFPTHSVERVKFKSFKTFQSFKPSERFLTVFLKRAPPTMKRLNGPRTPIRGVERLEGPRDQVSEATERLERWGPVERFVSSPGFQYLSRDFEGSFDQRGSRNIVFEQERKRWDLLTCGDGDGQVIDVHISQQVAVRHNRVIP